ncbi:MAG: DEAD/DEAH box helicase [Acidobacteria bacterium]|nr:DEAD/DEAH box helicase [Acidobacteriota bacterium]
MHTKKSAELTLRDKLSRLTLLQAAKLLGPEGHQLIRMGGKFEIVDFPGQVLLSHDRFELRLLGATVTISLKDDARRRLHWTCNACSTACEHAGAAFSTILEEKTALGLAAPPPERAPVENLGERELVRQAMDQRQARARDEKMILRSVNPKELWTDYVITSALSGKSYRVAVRGWEPGESYCSCPDFAKNTLGTCKHVLNALDKLKRRFPASTRMRPYRRTKISLHLRYGTDTELRLLLPERLDREAERIVRPLRDRAITDIHDLLLRIRRLEQSGRDVTIYPDAEEYIQQRLFQERIEQTVAEIRAQPKDHALRKTLLKTELLPYQLDGIAFAVGAGRAVLADDMGLGKTIQGIGIAEMFAREAGARKVLIVCPASVKSQWRSEIHRFSDRDCQLVLGSAEARARQYANGSFFTVCNYEQVLRDILAIEQATWDLIILDEGQRIKNWEAKTSRVIKGLKSPFALVLSGTPLENRLDDLFSVVEFIDDRRLGPAFRFFNRHRVVDERGKVLGYKSLGELRKNLEPILLRRTRASVMQELPPRTTEIIRITPTDEQLQLHGANMQIVSTIVSKKFISEMDLLRLQKALLLCRMTADSTFLVDKQPPGYSTKLEELDNLLGQLILEDGRKILLFSEWTTMLNLIEPLLKKRRVRFVRLDGSVPQKKRQQLVHEFQNDPRCTVFITTNAGATGLNLQAANTVINVDLPWNPAILEQRISRAHRMGQKRPVQVFVLVTEETIEENLLATLSAKHQLALAALDAESDVDSVDLSSGIDELKRRLEVLLGARPEASVDESQKADRGQEADRLVRRENVARAGGQLLSAAFTFLGEMIPSQGETQQSRELAGLFRSRLAECMEQDEQGRLKLTVTLPDSSALDALAGSLARLLAREVGVS